MTGGTEHRAFPGRVRVCAPVGPHPAPFRPNSCPPAPLLLSRGVSELRGATRPAAVPDVPEDLPPVRPAWAYLTGLPSEGDGAACSGGGGGRGEASPAQQGPGYTKR